MLKGHVMTEAHRLKLSLAHKGRTSPNKGKSMSEDQKIKLSIARRGIPSKKKGIPMSDIQKVKISETLKAKYASGELIAISRKHTELEGLRMSLAQIDKWCGVKHPLIGRKPTIEHRRHLSEARLKMLHNNSMNFTKKLYRSGRRSDLNNVYFRSCMEANFARILTYKNIEYDFETKSFPLSNGTSYTPDFFLPKSNCYIELKGYMWPIAAKKLELFKKEYPEIKLNIIFYTGSIWKGLYEKYSKIIPTWERIKGGK